MNMMKSPFLTLPHRLTATRFAEKAAPFVSLITAPFTAMIARVFGRVLDPSNPRKLWLLLLALLGVLGLGGIIIAQVEGERGIAPVVSSRDIDVGGIAVDVRGDSAKQAREKGWREGIRKAWAKIGGPSLPDSQLDSMVSAVVIEKEQISPFRYIATLGVTFDRNRAGRYLGGQGKVVRSAPMLLVPVMMTAGETLVYERRNEWQRAWASYQAGSSRIDYVRPSGAGGDSLLVNFGQIGRRSRTWWRNILDQFNASDVLVPIARLEHQWPGGPIKGTFTARHGPDNLYLTSFEMTASDPQDLDRMLTEAVQKFDKIYEGALAGGVLKPDSTLNYRGSGIDPMIQRLIDLGRAAREKEAAEKAQQEADSKAREDATREDSASSETPAEPAQVINNFVIQFASPDAGSIDATLAAVRATPGVRGAVTNSLAIGGTSVMSVSFAGSLSELNAALQSRGFAVNQGAGAIAISR